jgi:hypothetical protein
MFPFSRAKTKNDSDKSQRNAQKRKPDCEPNDYLWMPNTRPKFSTEMVCLYDLQVLLGFRLDVKFLSIPGAYYNRIFFLVYVQSRRIVVFLHEIIINGQAFAVDRFAIGFVGDLDYRALLKTGVREPDPALVQFRSQRR